MTVRAVVFDIGGVLERVDAPDFTDQWRRRLGFSVADFEAAVARVDPDGVVVTGGLSEQRLRLQYAGALGLSPEQADLFMADMWAWYCGDLDDALVSYVRGLRPRFKTGILSNSADGARREEERRYCFSELVDDIVYSHEVGMAKPDPAIFALTCQRLDVQPQEVVFVDDLPANVEAAASFGLRPVLHQRTVDTIARIERLVASG